MVTNAAKKPFATNEKKRKPPAAPWLRGLPETPFMAYFSMIPTDCTVTPASTLIT
jgi:hypothetical protein